MQFRSRLNGTKSGQSARWTFRAAPATCRSRPVPAYGRLGVSVVDSPALWGLRRPVDRAPRPAKPHTGSTCVVRHAARGAVNTILPPRPRVALQSRQLIQLALEVLLAAKSHAPLPLSQAGPSRRRAVHSAVPCCAAAEPAACIQLAPAGLLSPSLLLPQCLHIAAWSPNPAGAGHQ
jgi:hypothetical protein